jgi:hypothetical protein
VTDATDGGEAGGDGDQAFSLPQLLRDAHKIYEQRRIVQPSLYLLDYSIKRAKADRIFIHASLKCGSENKDMIRLATMVNNTMHSICNYNHFDGCDKIEQLGPICTLTETWVLSYVIGLEM